MENLIRISVITMMILFHFPVLNAQVEDSIYYEEEEYLEDEYDTSEPFGMFFSLDFDVSTPLFESKEKLDKTVFGFQTQLLFQIKKTLPVFMGLGFSLGRYDLESVEYYDFTEFEENLFRENMNCDVLLLEFKTRYFPEIKVEGLEPFIDLSMGFRNSFAYTSKTNVDYDETVNTRFHEADWGLGYGVGIGALVNMGYFTDELFGHISFNYQGGENSYFYLIKDNFSGTSEPIDRFDRKSIPYQFLKFNVGIIFYF